MNRAKRRKRRDRRDEPFGVRVRDAAHRAASVRVARKS